jgi:hypothetical protein
MENVKTASGTQLNNDLIDQVLSATAPKQDHPIVITPPSDNFVDLPAGYITPDGEVVKSVEVRELTGRDEEVIGKAGSPIKALPLILNRATLRIGDSKATEQMLDSLLIGDRDAILVGIYRATFGNETELAGYCDYCSDFKVVQVDISRDVQTRILVDSIEDRTFKVSGKNKEFLVTLPTGATQKELFAAENASGGERNTTLLKHCVLEIDGQPVMGKAQVQELGVMDRNQIAIEISKRLPGPQFEDIEIDCTDCEDGKVVVPFNLGALFRL